MEYDNFFSEIDPPSNFQTNILSVKKFIQKHIQEQRKIVFVTVNTN